MDDGPEPWELMAEKVAQQSEIKARQARADAAARAEKAEQQRKVRRLIELQPS